MRSKKQAQAERPRGDQIFRMQHISPRKQTYPEVLRSHRRCRLPAAPRTEHRSVDFLPTDGIGCRLLNGDFGRVAVLLAALRRKYSHLYFSECSFYPQSKGVSHLHRGPYGSIGPTRGRASRIVSADGVLRCMRRVCVGSIATHSRCLRNFRLAPDSDRYNGRPCARPVTLDAATPAAWRNSMPSAALHPLSAG